MTDERPRVDALLLAELIDSVPGRVRKRLDKDPEAALAWLWQQSSETWSIVCGEETVTLQTQQGVVRSPAEVACSCLLSPKCFHILACVSILSSAEPELAPVESAEEKPPAAAGREDAEAEEAVTPERREAARLVHSAASSLLAVGAKHAGLLLQSALLRAGHSCRSAGLINLGNTVLRLVEGIQRLRSNADTADGPQFVEDLAAAIEMGHTILNAPVVPPWMIGQARRSFEPIEVRKLEGICAEPILTLSGYAGVCVYLQEANDHPSGQPPGLYTINELRTGDSQLVHQAYRGGIELGSLSIAASEMCRRKLSVQGLSASSDGRLGKGRTMRWAALAPESEPARFFNGRFGLPLNEQIERVFGAAQLAPDQRLAGWDLVAFDATVLGPESSTLVVHVPKLNSAYRLRVAVDVPDLPYRENLQLLARCSGLRMRCLARLKLQAVGEFDLLAVVDSEPASANDDALDADPNRPTFAFPESWEGLCNIGLENLQRHHIKGIKRWSDEVVLGSDQRAAFSVDDGLAALRRRLLALGLGGRDAIPGGASSAHRRDLNRLRRSYQETAAIMLNDLATAAAEGRAAALVRGTERQRTSAPLQDVFLACHVYTREASLQFQRACWLNKAQQPTQDSA